MEQHERIAYLIKHLEGGNAANFCEKTGIDKSTTSNMMSGKIGIGVRVQKILSAYPCVNREWLETGDGDPGEISIEIVKEKYEAIIKEKDAIIYNLSTAIVNLSKK